jgi:predicted metal-binding membrane protein
MLLSEQRRFLGVCVVLFAASVAVTIALSTSMSAMDSMPMPGGWTMSMMWIPNLAGSFLFMWVVMMLAMMLPSLVPVLWRYRQAIGKVEKRRPGRLAVLVGAAYFFVWTLFGMAVFLSGMALTTMEMQLPALAHAVPIAIGMVVLIAGTLQFTQWKARHLARCRQAPGHSATLPATMGDAWRHGMRLGLHCGYCCANLTVILLVVGMMDLPVMAVVTAAITIERVAPAGERISRAVGVVAIGAGLLLIVRAVGSCRLTCLMGSSATLISGLPQLAAMLR